MLWMWNDMRNHRRMKFSRAYLNAIDEFIENPQIQSQCNFKRNELFKGWGDFFYIAKKDYKLFFDLESVMFNNFVFLENAVPTMMKCLNSTPVINCNHQPMRFIKKCVHVHPVKLSKSENQQLCLNRINSVNLKKKPKLDYFLVFSQNLILFILPKYKV